VASVLVEICRVGALPRVRKRRSRASVIPASLRSISRSEAMPVASRARGH